MRQPGIQIMINRDKDMIWIGSGNDCYSSLKLKSAAIDSCIKKCGKYTIPSNLEIDIEEKEGNVFNEAYIMTYDTIDIINYLSNKRLNHLRPKSVLNILKSYCRYSLYKDKGLYGTEDWYLGNVDLNKKYAKNIEDMIESSVIKIYKIADMEGFMNKQYEYEQVSIKELIGDTSINSDDDDNNSSNEEDIENMIEEITMKVLEEINVEEIEVEEVMNIEEVIKGEVIRDIKEEEIDKLLEIEAALRGYDSKEELIKTLISDRAVDLYNKIK